MGSGFSHWGDSTLDVIQVATALTLPLGYAVNYHLASWKW